MTQQLREAFRDLDDRSVPSPPDTAALWRRGRRRQRLRQGAAAAAVLAVVAAGGSWWVSGPMATDELPPVDSPTEQLRVPDAVREPEAWVRSIEQTGSPGPLAVVAKTTIRDIWLRERERWFGISAVDQDYHWLDLPGMAEDETASVALSPDGRYLGYHLGGTPPGASPASDVVGFAVYDTVTGEMTERRIPTEFGLSIDFGGLLWSSDSRRLVVTYGQWRADTGARQADWASTESWEPRTGRVVGFPVLDEPEFHGNLDASAGRIWAWQGRRLLGVDPSDGSVTRVPVDPPAPRTGVPGAPVWNPVSTRFAYRGERRDRPRGAIAAGYAAKLRQNAVVDFVMLTERWQPHDVHGWLDDRTALVEVGRPSGTSEGWRREILAWNVEANTVQPVIEVPDDALHDVQFATDALPNPFADVRSWRVPAPPPLVALTLAGLGGMLLWRRTRRTVAAPQADPEDDV